MQNLQYGRTGATMHYYPAYRPRFSDAVTKTVLSDCYILYWQYNLDMDDLGEIKAFPQYWDYMQRFMPVGIGKTDQSGYLRELTYLDDARIFDILRLDKKSVNGRNQYHLSIRPANRIHNQAQLAAKMYHKSMTAFTPNKAMAFMRLPLDVDDALDLDIFDLVEFGKQFQNEFLWCGQIRHDDILIRLPMHSLAWADRLAKLNSQLGNTISLYQAEAQPLVKNTLPIIQLRRFLSIYYRFPQFKDWWPRDQLNNMQRLLDECQAHIQQDYFNRIRQHIETYQYLVADAEENLLNLLLNDDIARQQLLERRYRLQCAENKITPIFRWSEDYLGLAFAESVRLLNQVPHLNGSDKHNSDLFDRYCQPLLNISVDNGGARGLGRNSFAQLVDFAVQLSPALAANFPGPPSLVVAVMNFIGYLYCKNGANKSGKDKISRQQLNSLLRMIHAVLKLLNGNKPLNSAAWNSLLENMRDGSVGLDQNRLIDLATDTFNSPLSKILGVAYQGLMRLILLYSLASRIEDNRDNPAKLVTGAIASGAGVVLSMEKFISSLFNSSGKRLEISLGFVAYLAEGVFSLLQAVDDFKKDETAALLGFGLGIIDIAASLVFVTMGIGVIFTGLLALSLVTAIASEWQQFIRASSRQTVLSLLDEIHAKYPDNDYVCQRVDDLYRLGQRIDWKRLSWRALVPLYEAGFGRNPIDGMLYDDGLKILNGYVDLTFMPQRYRLPGKSGGADYWNRAINNDGELDRDVAIPALNGYFADYFRVQKAARINSASQQLELIEWQCGCQFPQLIPTPVIDL